MEHTDAAQVFAVLGALGALLVLLPRDRFAPLAGFALLGLGSAGLLRSLVGDDDLELLLTEPAGLGLVALGLLAVGLGAIPLVRYPAAVPVALLVAAPFRIPIELGNEEAFLLVPLYLVLASAVVALAYRVLRGTRPARVPLFLLLPVAALAAFTSLSYLWTWDERTGAIALAFFVFPFTAALGVVFRAPVAAWLPRALFVTVVSLGALFALIGVWQAHTRTVFFARDVAVANAYTTFFRVTSLFKDPSLYGRYLVVPIMVLLVAVLLRWARPRDWIAAAAVGALLFWGLFYSYSQSSFVALFVATFAVALLVLGRWLRVVLLVSALAASLAAAAIAAEAIEGRPAKEVTSGRSRLVSVTVDVFREHPLAGVGVGGQPRASADLNGGRSRNRSASHTTPLTVLAEQGVVGFALYAWLLGAAGWALVLLARRDRLLGVELGAVLLVLVAHSLLYAGFFEDPLTWGVLGLTAAALAATQPQPAGPPQLAH